LGLAFQIADDVLNETGNEEQLGKASGSDRARGKQTYVAVMGVDGARAAAEREISAALAALDDMPGETDTLRTFARYVIDRQH
jgi:geranylgeranyl pyrophosphate synthase